MRFLRSVGLRPTVGDHAFDEYGCLAGRDEDRLADLNDALRDPDIKAIIATTGRKNAYRIAEQIGFAAAARHPNLLIGFSEITVLHLALWKHCRLPGIHGAPFQESWAGAADAASFLDATFTGNGVVVRRRTNEPTGALTATD